MRREPTDVPRQDQPRTSRHASLASTTSMTTASTRQFQVAEGAYAHPVIGGVPRGAGYDTTISRPEGFFLTPDTAPSGLSVTRSRWVAPLLLLLFAASAAGVDRWVIPLTHAYSYTLVGLARVPPGTFGKQGSVALPPPFLLLAGNLSVLPDGS